MIVLENNFVLRNEVSIDSNSTAYLYEHVSGAQLMFVKNDDHNKVFSVSFKTLPSNDKGTAHVLEHCTLCGSEKFPFKDTFNEISSCSLYTYLNAMTFKDKTVYAVASMYETELKKLINIYLDCAFNPLLRLETFLHEAWHYEKTRNNLDVNGVVYSEMKSTFSNPVRETRSFIHKKLFPDTIYQYESSGIPKNILELKHEELITFHKKYYTAQNCFLYLYGNIEVLEFYMRIFDSYLSENTGNKILIVRQKPFSESVIANGLYDFSGAQKKYFGVGFVIDTALNLELLLAFDVLNSYLSKMVGAPLKKFLPLVKTFFESEIYQPVYSILSENFNGSTEKFKATILQIFGQIYSGGLNKTLLESCINNLEFEMRTSFHKHRPKGLIMNLLILTDWIYGGNPFSKMDRIKVLDGLREKISDNYFEEIIKNHILFNKHSVFTSLTPNGRDNLQFKISSDDIKNAELMKKFIDSKDETKKPIVMADVYSTDFNGFDEIIDHSTDVSKILYTEIDTERVIYLCFNFKTDGVDEKLLPYVGILAETLVFTALQKNSSENMQTVINNVGSIKVNFDTYSKDNIKYIPALNLKIKLLPGNFDNIIDMLRKIFSIQTFDSQSLVKKLLMQKFVLMGNSFLTNPIDNVTRKIISYTNQEYKYKDSVNGIRFYSFLKELNKNFDDEYHELIKKLFTVFNIIFTRENSLVHITCDKENFKLIYSKINDLMQIFPSVASKPVNYKFIDYEVNEAFFNLSTMNTNAMIIPLSDFESTGFSNVFETFMNKIYLMREIRINGGAYDSGCKFKNSSVYFYSYADPNIDATYRKFSAAADYIDNYSFTCNDFQKCVVSAVNNFDKPRSFEERAELSLSRYLSHITFEEAEDVRGKILLATIPNVKKIAAQIKNNLDKAMICTIGNRSSVFDSKDLFSSITKL